MGDPRQVYQRQKKKKKGMLETESNPLFFRRTAQTRPVWPVMGDYREAGFRTWDLGVKLDPRRAHPENGSPAHPHHGASGSSSQGP